MKKRNRTILIVLVAVLALIAIAVSVAVRNMEKELEPLATAQIRQFDLSKISDGAYPGRFSAGPVAVKVEVIIQDGRIDNILLLEHNNGQGQPAEAIIPVMIEEQTIAVDVIAGATYSSKVIQKAVEDALDKAN